MTHVIDHPPRRPAGKTFAARATAMLVAALAVIVFAAGSAGAQATGSVATRSTGNAPTQSTANAPAPAPTAANASPRPAAPDLQGLWDFTMRVGERTSTGFLALGPVDGAWAGSITPDSTNTLAIRVLTVTGDSVRMVVASREGDVPFRGRLAADGDSMEGIVEYHGGALLPMTATRRARRAVQR